MSEVKCFSLEIHLHGGSETMIITKQNISSGGPSCDSCEIQAIYTIIFIAVFQFTAYEQAFDRFKLILVK